jgi:3-methyladenine DNA glycosylase AlkD
MKTFNEVRNYIDQELKNINNPITKDIRDISRKTYQKIEDRDLSRIIDICDQLLKTKIWHYKTIAFDMVFKVKQKYHKETFEVFERWLFDHVNDWGDCDDFCTHAFGHLLMIYPELFLKTLAWKNHEKFAVRRATAVILIYPIRKNRYQAFDPLLVSDMLMHDEHYLVLKGYGWLLKVLSQKEPLKVYNYLQENHNLMPRVAFRYAVEKLSKIQKDELMGL